MAFVQRIQATGDIVTLTIAHIESVTPEDRTDEIWAAINQMCHTHRIQRALINQAAAKVIQKAKDV